MSCFASPFCPSARTFRPRLSTCNHATPISICMSQRNAGEDYIWQLANQSAENARKRQQAAEKLPIQPPVPRNEGPNSGPYLRDGVNAGEEYIRALSAKSARAPEETTAPVRRKIEEVATNDPVAAQLDALNREAEILEKAIAAAKNIPSSDTHIDIEEQISSIESRLNATTSPPPTTESQDPINAYEKMREEVGRHVAPNNNTKNKKVIPMPQVDESEKEIAAVYDGEAGRMWSAMTKIRLEMDRYSKELKLLQEQHDNNLKNIIETHMSGM